ncbi:hypothetical protein ACT4S5_18570 [Kocuria oceani]|uniref:hypothetical protein n=1 Tax=Kocuria oceani TaxID=988827 RepID=UPI004037383E
MRSSAICLLVLSALVLTGCGPTADDIQTMVEGPAETYDDAVALREAVVDAGVQCPGTDQLSAPEDPQTTFLDCGNGLMGMAVAGSDEAMEGFVNTLGDRERIPFPARGQLGHPLLGRGSAAAAAGRAGRGGLRDALTLHRSSPGPHTWVLKVEAAPLETEADRSGTPGATG